MNQLQEADACSSLRIPTRGAWSAASEIAGLQLQANAVSRPNARAVFPAAPGHRDRPQPALAAHPLLHAINAALPAGSALSPPVQKMLQLQELALHKKLPPPRRRQGGVEQALASEAAGAPVTGTAGGAVHAGEPSIEAADISAVRQTTSENWSTHGGLISLDALRIGRALNTLLRQARVPSDIARALPPAIAAPVRALLAPVVEAASRGRGADSSAKGEGLGIAPLAGSGTEAKDNRARISTAVQLLQQHATKVYAQERSHALAATPAHNANPNRKESSFGRL